MGAPDGEAETDEEGSVTILLREAQAGDTGAADRLFLQLQAEMRRTAAAMLRNRSADFTLQPTAIVNEAIVRLLQDDAVGQSVNRRYLFGAANQAMSRALIDHARKRKAKKRPAGSDRQAMDHVLDSLQARSQVEFTDLAEALEELRKTSPRQAEVTELRFFSALNNEQIAEVLEISLATVKRDWSLARAKLYRILNPESTS